MLRLRIRPKGRLEGVGVIIHIYQNRARHFFYDVTSHTHKFRRPRGMREVSSSGFLGWNGLGVTYERTAD